MPLSPRTIIDQYEILAPLGAGGMGEVYRARDSRLNREVAIKVLPELFTTNPDRLRRFEQEARAAAALKHPNILVVYELGSHDGVPYLVSELLEGETLRERLRQGSLPLRKVIDYGTQIASGLAAAHEKGIVHRDLKPENLFLTKDGQVKILDFGLAKMVQPNALVTGMEPVTGDQTEPGYVMGTASYMSPEQVRGRAADHRSDIFSFSAILYEMLTGKRAFHKPTSAETMNAILNEEPVPIAQLAPNTPLALQRVLHRGLEKNAEQRFQSASDLAFALEALSDTTILTLPVGHMLADKRSTRLRPGIVGGTLAAVLALGVVVFLWTRPEPVPSVSNYVQLTHDGLQKSLIGTDGSRLYLSLITSAMEGVSTLQTTGGEQTRIPMPGTDMVPISLSSDGSQFLLVEGRGVPLTGPLWSLPVLGGSPRRLGDVVGTDAAWTPDGKMLAYTNGDDLFLAKADGTESRKLLAMNSLISNPTWAPDGSRLRFDTSDFSGTGIGQHMIWEVTTEGLNPHRLLSGWHNPPDECCGNWTADGKYFVFQSQGQIWAMPTERRLLHPEPKPIQLTSSPMSLHSAVPSKDGKKLFVVGRTYRGALTRWNMKSGQFQPFLDGISAEYVAFSKNGQWVAYVSYPEGTLWKCKEDGSDRVQLTFPPLRAVLPRWSPDDQTIVFFDFPVSSTQPGRIYVISSERGSPRELMPLDTHNQQDPNWSPDGSRIVFSGDPNDATVANAAPAIRVLDLKSQQVSTLPSSQGLFSPRWSPDGRSIAAMTSDSSTIQLFDLHTQKWTELAKGTFGWLNWSRDGQSIYTLDFTGEGAVVKIRISSHAKEQVVDLKDFVTTGQYGGSLALTPDDSPLLLRDSGTQDVYALDWEAP